MKTINGFTYEQLRTLSPKELNEIQANWAVDKIRASLVESEHFPEEKKEIFCQEVIKGALELYSSTLDEFYYSRLSSVYDSYEKFEIMADMISSVEGMARKMVDMVGRAILDLNIDM